VFGPEDLEVIRKQIEELARIVAVNPAVLLCYATGLSLAHSCRQRTRSLARCRLNLNLSETLGTRHKCGTVA
jgi:hypothetical protein